MSKTVLIVEDEARIAHWVKSYFEMEGFQTLVTGNGRTGLQMARQEKPDLVILDLMLPGMAGEEVCRAIRRESPVPIIILTAKGAEEERINGLDLGADDYVVKPFSPKELVARGRAVLRRIAGDLEPGNTLEVGDVSLDLEKFTCLVNGKQVALSRTQFAVLETLMQHKGQVLSREQILTAAFPHDFDGFDRTIDAHIRRIRRRLEPDPSQPRYILTVFGVGYKFEG